MTILVDDAAHDLSLADAGDLPPAAIDVPVTRLRDAAASRPKVRRGLPQGAPGAGMPVLSVVTVLALLALWAGVTQTGLVKPLFLPGPAAILKAFGQSWTGDFDGNPLLVQVGASLARVVGAFLLASAIGIPAGLAMGVSRPARAVLDPLIEFYRPLPPLAYLPLMVIWFGIGETAKVLLIFLACFAPVALATRAGVLSASADQVNAARSMGASRWQVLLHVVLPAATPDILVGLRIGMGVGWTTLVAAEMVAANAGLGQMVLNASNFLRTDVVVMGILVIGLFAVLFEVGMRWLERVLVPWKGKS
ncbi:ABC transporter permease subunit [Lichenibacterium minor]|uniref:ABC transporter permease subunit n=1 Tax=Lichenibacterium minor TaxID=2316528 RepID=A0A4Q2U2X7_9HYPH|nr:ABC transporter permease subunit [Lichenibacterium minor]RYC30088.1 ABC transporter permease subunit [Lichenibacterium minor]